MCMKARHYILCGNISYIFSENLLILKEILLITLVATFRFLKQIFNNERFEEITTPVEFFELKKTPCNAFF